MTYIMQKKNGKNVEKLPHERCINKDIVLNEKNNSHFLSEKQHPTKINNSTGFAGINLHCGKIVNN